MRVDDLPQLPGLNCLECDVCCRFSDPATEMAPGFSARELRSILDSGLDESPFTGADSAIGEQALLTLDSVGARCPVFHRESNGCRSYEHRPLDCRLYPLALMYDEAGAAVLLGADLACPAIERITNTAVLGDHVAEVARLLDTSLLEMAYASRSAIGEFKPWMEEKSPLPELTRRVCRPDLGLRRLTLSAVRDLAPIVNARSARLAAHGLPAVRAWVDMMDLYWTVEEDRLILVAGGDGPAFLIAPPLGPGPIEPAVRRGVEILRQMNPRNIPPRIQEVDDETWPTLNAMGFQATHTYHEYVYDRKGLATLAGRHYKGKRAARNHFVKHHDAVFRAFHKEDLPECVGLYRTWRAHRAADHPEPMFAFQLQAGAIMYVRALREAEELGLRGRVLEADGRIVACTAGFEVPGGEQFAVLLEVADRTVKGAAAYCYQKFCAEVDHYPLINAMTDSGLPSLAAAKELYHPIRRQTSRIVALSVT